MSGGRASPWPPRWSRCGTPRERGCCHRYQRSACLSLGWASAAAAGSVKLLFSAAGASGQHQPCSRASFIAPLGSDVLQPASFGLLLRLALFVPCPAFRKGKLKFESINPVCELGCLHCCEFSGGVVTVPFPVCHLILSRLIGCLVISCHSPVKYLQMYTCIYVYTFGCRRKVVFSLSSF